MPRQIFIMFHKLMNRVSSTQSSFSIFLIFKKSTSIKLKHAYKYHCLQLCKDAGGDDFGATFTWWSWSLNQSLLLIQTSKPFFKPDQISTFSSKQVQSNFKRRLGFLSSLEDFLSINAFLKVNLMKKYDFEKSCQLGFVFVVQGMTN